MKVRLANVADAQEILNIYAPYVINTNITFEYTVPTLEEFRNRMEIIMKKYPYIVAVSKNRIVGYAYAHEYKERAAYQWNVETSIYVDENLKHQGIGSLLYRKLLDILALQNVQNVYACVTLPNQNSEKLHHAFQFELVGRFHNSGYKLNQWHDVGWFERSIGNRYNQNNMSEVIPISRIIAQAQKILASESD